jgi:hypothetical protein
VPLPALLISRGSPRLLIDDTAACLHGFATTVPKPAPLLPDGVSTQAVATA